MKLNIIDGQFFMGFIDPQDVLFDRYMNPWDIETARRVTHACSDRFGAYSATISSREFQ